MEKKDTSLNGMLANRESDLRDMLQIIRMGQTAFNMREGLTINQAEGSARIAGMLSEYAHTLYRSRIG